MTEADNIPKIDSLTDTEKKPNWGKRVLIIAVVVFIGIGLLRFAAAHVLMKRLPAMIVTAAEQMFDYLKLPDEERKAAMVPIKDLADKIANKEVTFAQVRKVNETLAASQVQSVLCARLIDLRFIPPSSLTDEEKQAGHIVVTRFAHGLRHGKSRIPPEQAMPLTDLISVKTTNEKGEEILDLKDGLTDEELQSCLTLMLNAANEAEIPDQAFEIDLAAELQSILDTGLKK